jgi:hypothetical protein
MSVVYDSLSVVKMEALNFEFLLPHVMRYRHFRTHQLIVIMYRERITAIKKGQKRPNAPQMRGFDSMQS